jgi:hypothetical protein
LPPCAFISRRSSAHALSGHCSGYQAEPSHIRSCVTASAADVAFWVCAIAGVVASNSAASGRIVFI